jgi:hypothetical protein
MPKEYTFLPNKFYSWTNFPGKQEKKFVGIPGNSGNEILGGWEESRNYSDWDAAAAVASRSCSSQIDVLSCNTAAAVINRHTSMDV